MNAPKILWVVAGQVLVYGKDKTVVRATFRSFLDHLTYTQAMIEAYLDFLSMVDLLTEQRLAFSVIVSKTDQLQQEPALVFHVLTNFSVKLPLPPSLAPL